MKRLLPGLLGGAIIVALSHMLPLAFADQSERVTPTAGIFNGPAFSQKIGDFARSVSTMNSGSTAPANVGGSVVDGLDWLDTSVTPYIKKRYVNGSWVIEGYLDPTNGIYIPVTGGGSNTIAAGSTVDLGSVPQKSILISGTATITSFGSSAIEGIEKTIRFDNASVLTPSNALLVPGNFPLTTAAGDRALVTSLGSGNWEVTQYTRANGIPIDVSAVATYKFGGFSSVPAFHVAGMGQKLLRTSYPAYLALSTRQQNGTRVSGNATISGIADTTGFAAGMPVESTGVGSGCTILSLVANTSITLNSSSCVTASGTSTVTVFLHGYGTGGDNTTVGVDDCRNRTLAGRDRNDPGSFAGLITSAGSGINGQAFSQAGGAQSKSLLQTDLPNIAPAIDASTAVWNTLASGSSLGNFGPGSTSSYINSLFNGGTAGGGVTNWTSKAGLASGAITAASINGNVTQTAFSLMIPTLIAECVVRVTP